MRREPWWIQKSTGGPLKAPRSLALCSVLVAALLLGTLAHAQSYFRVSPGPLNEGHAAYDHSEGCKECHESAEGVTNAKCLACHAAVRHKGGLHGTFGGKRCITCHTEHKGRSYNIIDWNQVGGRDTFKHDVTAFALKNEHARLACTQCHVRRLKSGRVSYLSLSPDCQSCHRDEHGFRRNELRTNCKSCHEDGNAARGWKLSNWKAQHETFSRVNFQGKHTDQLCTKCHEGAVMAGRPKPRTCPDCHAPPHPIVQSTENCQSCHKQTGDFKGAHIDHDQFGFPLVGKHGAVGCQNCHGKANQKAPRKTTRGRAVRTCVACHAAIHPVVRETANCVACHTPGGTWRGAKFDHTKTGFGLFGKHTKLRCRSCHKQTGKLPSGDNPCSSCHTHRNAHRGQFADKPCASCHVEGGTRTTPFDHNHDSRFPLVGFHASLAAKKQCRRCHPGGIYRTGKLTCPSCHEDKHKGSLGEDCKKCHSPLQHFSAPRSKDFPHTWFPLEGKHGTIACASCHPNGKYKIGKHQCVDCHLKDDRHRGKLGRDCGKCHIPAKGAPKFDHDTMTHFRRTGRHRQAACALCHQPRRASAPPPTLAEWRRTAVPALDRTFPVRGTHCADCHRDPHNGYVGTDCAQCHTTSGFRNLSGAARAIKPNDHRGAWIRLHATLPPEEAETSAASNSCSICHGVPGCRNCHRTHPPRTHTGLWRLKTHGSAADFDSQSCRVCHSTGSCVGCHRRTPPLSHRGAWGTRHGYAAGGFGDNNCFVCHGRAHCAQCHTGPPGGSP
jgi:hypothetical protein